MTLVFNVLNKCVYDLYAVYDGDPPDQKIVRKFKKITFACSKQKWTTALLWCLNAWYKRDVI